MAWITVTDPQGHPMKASRSGFTASAWGGAHAMGEMVIDLEGALLEQLCGQRSMVCDWHDLIVVAMHHERRHIDALQILGEVGLREGFDALVVRFGAARHALSPPILNDAGYWLRTRPVEAVER